MGSTGDLLHLGSFLLALGAGFHHLASGRGGRGVLVVAGAFALFDFALVRGYVYQVQDGWTWAALAALHGLGVGELGLVVWRAWSRRRLVWKKRRAALIGQAGEHYAAGRFAEALGPLALAGRGDPWDPAPRVWQGYCRLQLGQAARARRAFRRARALDRKGEWEHALRQGLGRLQTRAVVRPALPRPRRGKAG